MLPSLLSLPGEGFEGSFAALPLAVTAGSAAEAPAALERLVCSSLRGSGLGCDGGACSAGCWIVISCCSFWLCRSRSWTRSSKMASCSSWMAWFRWVFLFCVALKKNQPLHLWQNLQKSCNISHINIKKKKPPQKREFSICRI